MTQPRTPRSVAEMVERLRVQVELLRDYMIKVQQGDKHYLGEIANKLRLLAIESRSNKALMLRIGKLVDGTPMVEVKGAPGWTHLSGHKTGDVIPFEEWLDMEFMEVKGQRMTKREFILAWAQQSGGSHEDWSLDERLAAGRASAKLFEEHFIPIDMTEQTLMGMADVVRIRGEQLLQHMTPERIAQAQRVLDGRS